MVDEDRCGIDTVNRIPTVRSVLRRAKEEILKDDVQIALKMP
jgi:DNA-binding FrmR family transcriptional regulator